MKNLLLFIFCFMPFLIMAQIHIYPKVEYNYWQHTNLNGLEGGIKILYQIKNGGAYLGFSFGAGEKNGLKKFESKIDPSLRSTYVDTNPSLSLGFNRNSTDHARQLRLNIGYEIRLASLKQMNIGYSFGGYLCNVQNFRIVDVITGYEIAYEFPGSEPYNLILISENKFLTAGVHNSIYFDFSNYLKINPRLHINFALGPKKSSYFGLGLEVGGPIQ